MKNELQKTGFWVGTYSTSAAHVPDARGRGIYRGELDLRNGRIDVELAADEIRDASYLARRGKLLAAVSEIPDGEGAVHLYEISDARKLIPLARFDSGGRHPCHIGFLDDDLICVANYLSGSVRILRRTDTGWQAGSLEPYTGQGPNAERQEHPHPHQCLFLKARNELLVADLGSDRVWIHPVEKSTINPRPESALELRPGTGPRHMAFDEGRARLYVLGELGDTVTVFGADGRRWQREQEYVLRTENEPSLSPAAIRWHPSHSELFVSARRPGEIFRLPLAPDGAVRSHERVSTHGSTPRDFAIDPYGRWILAANQDSHSLVSLDLANPLSAPASEVGCPSPVCIIFDADQG